MDGDVLGTPAGDAGVCARGCMADRVDVAGVDVGGVVAPPGGETDRDAVAGPSVAAGSTTPAALGAAAGRRDGGWDVVVGRVRGGAGSVVDAKVGRGWRGGDGGLGRRDRTVPWADLEAQRRSEAGGCTWGCARGRQRSQRARGGAAPTAVQPWGPGMSECGAKPRQRHHGPAPRMSGLDVSPARPGRGGRRVRSPIVTQPRPQADGPGGDTGGAGSKGQELGSEPRHPHGTDSAGEQLT